MNNRKRIEEEEEDERKTPRVLCLHGFRTSGEISKEQVLTKWPESVVKKLHLVFIDAPFPSQGKSDVEVFYDPPYYEWELQSIGIFDECLEYVEDIMIKQGSFDGLLGFSQGGKFFCRNSVLCNLKYGTTHAALRNLKYGTTDVGLRIEKSSQFKEKGLKDADLLRSLFNRKFSPEDDTDRPERTESNDQKIRIKSFLTKLGCYLPSLCRSV
ncbi:hypothetical protein C5167_050913 [Papaver somniferum]|uniref:Serine hydrolase domain-containing protein n=1 Tax=Papaver somniferum TaxID=3469 RepID=A0A4Y7KTI5_PAPSO|nr:hypothetical protein C5167_050913 [Papaver somniferum]